MCLSLFQAFGGPEKDQDLNYIHSFIYKVYYKQAQLSWDRLKVAQLRWEQLREAQLFDSVCFGSENSAQRSLALKFNYYSDLFYPEKILILLWSLVFDTHVFHILTLY